MKHPDTTGGRLSTADIKEIAKLLCFAALLVLGIKYFTQVMNALGAVLKMLSPFFLGGAIAFALNVPMRQIEKGLFGGARARKKPRLQKAARPVSLVLTLLSVAVLLALVVLVVAPQMGKTSSSLAASAQAFLPKVQKWATETFENNEQVAEWMSRLQLDWDKIGSSISSSLKNGIGNVLSSGLSAALSVLTGVSNFFIGLIFACYILMQKEKLGDQTKRLLRALLPQTAVERISHVSSMAFSTFSSFIRGQCLEAVILGSMFVVTMTILGLSYPLMVGVLVAFTALIPIFGAYIGCAVGAVMELMVSPLQALIFIIMFVLLQQIEGNFIYPHVVGGSVGLPSIWVLVAVTVGGSLMGIAGMLLFIPLTSVLYALLRDWTNRCNKKKDELQSAEAAAAVSPEKS